MIAAVITHVESEGPGTLGDFLLKQGFTLMPVRLWAGDGLPPANSVDVIVSMGGPMNVYEEDKFPFLSAETTFLKSALNENIPTIGVCLGAQMIAKAAGAKVGKSPNKEVGWSTVALTQSGLGDPLFRDLPKNLPVLQWHEDMFDIPNGADRLAASDLCPNQAFRLGNAVGLQFHVEITSEIIKDWFSQSQDLDSMLDYYGEHYDGLKRQAERMYLNFIKPVGN